MVRTCSQRFINLQYLEIFFPKVNFYTSGPFECKQYGIYMRKVSHRLIMELSELSHKCGTHLRLHSVNSCLT